MPPDSGNSLHEVQALEPKGLVYDLSSIVALSDDHLTLENSPHPRGELWLRPPITSSRSSSHCPAGSISGVSERRHGILRKAE